MNGDHLGGIGDESVGKLGEMDKPVLLDAYIDKSSEVGDVADIPGRVIPSRRSLMVRTLRSNSNT